MAKPLVVILGPTASGKSSLSVKLAKKFNGEIICADSRTVYKGMDIGTAKPSIHDRRDIPHHLLDVVDPDVRFSAAQFKELASEVVEEIEARHKLPIMAGGTGLYIDSVIFDFAFLPKSPLGTREELERLSIAELQEKIKEEHIQMPLNNKNKRHLIRAIETNGQVPVRRGIRKNTLVLGIFVPRDELRKRIGERTVQMINDNLEHEAKELAEKYGWKAPGLTSVGYKEWNSSKDKSEIINDINTATMQYAKRQMTWFKRNEHINWISNEEQAIKLVQNFLQHNENKNNK